MSHTKSHAYSLPARLLHWVMAVLILAMLFIGAAMVATVGPDRIPLFEAHKVLGAFVLILVLARIAVRLRKDAPALPDEIPGPVQGMIRLSHLGFYGLMLVMPLIGWAMQSAAGNPVMLMGTLHLPPLVDPDAGLFALLRPLHRWLAYLWFFLIVGHAMAALYHGFVRRDGILQSMTTARH